MKFDVGPRQAEFGVFNNRAEKHGQEKVKALDLPFKIAITMKELDVIVPLQTGKFSEMMYDKKKNLQTFVLSPLAVNRKPENIEVEIYDIEARANAKPLTLKECKIKDPVLTFEEKGIVFLSGKIQVSAVEVKDVERIIEGVENKARKMQFWATQPELPMGQEEEEEDDETSAGENDRDEGKGSNASLN